MEYSLQQLLQLPLEERIIITEAQLLGNNTKTYRQISMRRQISTITLPVLLMLCFLLMGKPYKTQAQAPTISYPTVAQNLTRGYGESNLTVRLVFNGVCTGTNTVRIALPSSVSYVAGSVTKTGGTAGVTISESSISNLRRPEFLISGIAATGNRITFTVARRADCGSFVNAKDSVYFIAGAGCSDISETSSTVNNYNILSPALTLTPPPALTDMLVGSTATRSTLVTNGGIGVLDTLHFYNVYPAGGIVNTSGTNAITANGTSFTPIRISGDTFFYKIYGATLFSGTSTLNNSESVTILEPIRIVKCNTVTTYGAGWGRNDTTICNTTTATSSIAMKPGVPNLTTVRASLVGYTNKCTPYEVRLIYPNNGSGDDTAATMYNVTPQVGMYFDILRPIDSTVMELIDFKVGTVTLTGSTVKIGTAPNFIYEVNFHDKFTSDPDGAGVGLADMDGDGYFDDLPAGQTLTINISAVNHCTKDCGSSIVQYNIGGRVLYYTMCNNIIQDTSAASSGGLTSIYEASFTGTGYIPANVQNGVPFRIKAAAAYYLNQSIFDLPTTRYRWKIALPPGFSVSGGGAATYNGASVSYTTISGGLSGVDTLLYTSASNSLSDFQIDLVVACGAGGASSGSSNVYYELTKINDITAPECICDGKKVCAYLSTRVFCPGPCIAGPGNYIPVVRRANGSLGWTDYTLSTRQSASAITAYDLSKALYLDTIIVQSSAKQGGTTGTTSNNLHLELSLPKTSGGISKLMAIKAVTKLFNASGALIGSGTISSASGAASTASSQSVDWDLSSLLPGGVITSGDSIYSEAYYVVATNTGLPTNDVQSGGGNIYYNLAAGVKQYCTNPVPEMYLVGTSPANGHNTYIASGCSAVTLGGNSNYYARRFNSAGTVFHNEFRPGFLIDSIIVTLPGGYQSNSFIYTALSGGSSYRPISPSSVTGNTYKFVNPGWAAGGITVTNDYASLFEMNVRPTCATAASEVIDVKTYIRDYYYAYAGNPTPAGLAYTIESVSSTPTGQTIFYSNKPDIKLDNQTGTVQAISSTHSWTMRIHNTGLGNASYIWFALPSSGHTGINVTQATVISTSTTLTPIAYAGGKWYQASTSGIPSAGYIDVRLDFTYTSCDADSIKVYGGWDCASYPADPNAYGCKKDSVFLKMDPLPAQIQTSILREPGGGSSINLCTTDSTVLIVNSAQAANLKNPSLVFYPPTGVTLITPVMVEYPLGSGDYQAAAVTTVGSSGYRIDLTGHTSIGDDLPGTDNANITVYPTGEDRQARIGVRFITDCNYSSGSPLYFTMYSNEPCGQAATGNALTVSTDPLTITGASTSGSAGISLTLGGRTSFTCGEVATVTTSVTPTTTSTAAGDTMVYTIPLGLHYIPGTLTGTGISTTPVISGGRFSPQTFKVAIDPGTPESTPVNFSFDCTVNSGGDGCTENMFTVAYKRNIPPLMCGATTCANSSVIIANSSSPGFVMNKPSLTITAMTKLDESPTWTMGGWLNIVQVDYTNNGVAAYTAYTDTIEFYCNTSGTVPFYRGALRKDVPAGGSVSDTFAIHIPGTPCMIGDFVEARIPVVKSNNGFQCLCNPSARSASARLPLSLLSFKLREAPCSALLEWTFSASALQNMQEISVQRSMDGKNFETMVHLPPSVQTYTDIVPYNGVWMYRLRAIQKDKLSEYSEILRSEITMCAGNPIEVYPNPASDEVYILLQGGGSAYQYELTDAMGRKVLTGSLIQNHQNRLEVQHLQPGLYMLHTSNNDGQYFHKIMISHSK